MEIYSTSFTYPGQVSRLPPPAVATRKEAEPSQSSSSTSSASKTTGPNVPPSSNFSAATTTTTTTTTTAPTTISTATGTTTARRRNSVPPLDPVVADRLWERVQGLCNEITAREGCPVSVTCEADVVTVPVTLSDFGSDDDPATQQLNVHHNFHQHQRTGIHSTTTFSSQSAIAPIAGSVSPVIWNFHLSGPYQSVLAARGAILREVPRDNRIVLKVPRADILESPLAAVSALKYDVRLRMENIATDSLATITIVNPEGTGVAAPGAVLAVVEPKQWGAHEAGSRGSGESGMASPSHSALSAPGRTVDGDAALSPIFTFTLETERTCELVIAGTMESVEIAKVRLLVMLDELSGLSSDVCEIDYKLQAIIGNRKRSAIQAIQEETAVNIYFPTPLVGVFNPPQPGSQHHVGYSRGHMALNNNGAISAQATGMSYMSINNGNGTMNVPPMNGLPMGAGGGDMGGIGGVNPMGMGGMNTMGGSGGMQMGGAPGFPVPNPNQHQRGVNGAAPIYNPQQHVHYPHSPQPLPINPQMARGMPYAGPGAQWAISGAVPTGMQVNHTGMSQMTNGGPIPSIPGYTHRAGSIVTHGGQSNANIDLQPPHHSHLGIGNNPSGIISQNPTGMGYQHPPPIPTPEMRQYSNQGGFHPGLNVHWGEQGMLGKSNLIWITGESFNVSRARDMLLNIAMQKSRLVISRDTSISPRKLDWLLTQRLEDLRGIMCDNGTYIQVPAVGSQASLLTVFGDHRVNVERTIRSIMTMACQFYSATFWLLPVAFDVLMPQATLNPSQMQPILKHISHVTGAEIVFKSGCFECHGLETEVRAAVKMIMELEIIQNFQQEVRFQVELATEFRDFISGKKNGKINKIMKTCNVQIKYETVNDYNFVMTIAGHAANALKGLTLLQLELPAEMSFHVPEGYHKRIIGIGGKNIQRIMRTYGVYVKFSNAEEFAALGGYLDNEDNVVVRTPAKNAYNLDCLKNAIMEQINPKDKDYTVESVSIPKRYHRTLLGEKSIFIHDIERKTNSMVRFPNKETASDMVSIFGPESQVHIAAAMLLDHVPYEADLHVPPNPDLTRLVSSTEFIMFTEDVKREHHIAVQASQKFGQGDEAVFKFRCQRSNFDFLSSAREALEEFVSKHGVQLYPPNNSRKIEASADAFSLFNSKLLAPSASRESGSNGIGAGRSGVGAVAGGVGGEGETSGITGRNTSGPANIRALFHNPIGGVQVNAAPVLAPIPQAALPLRALDDSAAMGFSSVGYRDGRMLYGLNGTGMSSSSRDKEEQSKRGSDPVLEDKLRMDGNTLLTSREGPPHPHPGGHQARAVSARTQSLDITSLNFARSLSNSGPQLSNANNSGSGPASATSLGAPPLISTTSSSAKTGHEFSPVPPSPTGAVTSSPRGPPPGFNSGLFGSSSGQKTSSTTMAPPSHGHGHGHSHSFSQATSPIPGSGIVGSSKGKRIHHQNGASVDLVAHGLSSMSIHRDL